MSRAYSQHLKQFILVTVLPLDKIVCKLGFLFLTDIPMLFPLGFLIDSLILSNLKVSNIKSSGAIAEL